MSWFLALPVVLWLGVRRVDYMAAIAVPAAVCAVLCVIATRKAHIGRPIQYGMIASMMIASMGLSRLFGPLILMPTMIGTWAIVVQAHPDRRMRVFVLVCGAIALTLPMALELLGVVPASYAFEGGRMAVLPQMHELPRGPTLGFLFVANAAMVVMPAIYVGQLRAQLAAAQQQQLVQAWHFRRLPLELASAR
jgi:serine/threonine-protein kinase